MCHVSKQTTFQVKIMKPPYRPPPPKYTHTHTLSNTVHQLSSSCHDCRQPGSGIYSQSIQNGPCHFLLNFTSTEGTIKMMSFGGRTVEENHAHQANCPLQECAGKPTAWDCTCRWHTRSTVTDHIPASQWNSEVGSRIRWCDKVVCSDHFEGD